MPTPKLFWAKADAKVYTFSEPAKLFRKYFEAKTKIFAIFDKYQGKEGRKRREGRGKPRNNRGTHSLREGGGGRKRGRRGKKKKERKKERERKKEIF